MAANKRVGKKSLAQNDFLQPAKPIINSATDVGTNRAFNNGAVSVAFSLPSTSAPATSYTVTASTGQSATGSVSPITVSGFATGATPTFTVVATNADGPSETSLPSGSVTVTTVPSAPTIGSISNVGAGRAFNDGAVSVTFTAPVSNGGKTITNYLVTANTGQAGSGASSPVVVGGIASSASVYAYAIAQNANGSSAASSATSNVTVTTVPASPVVSASSPSAGVDTVSWSIPNDGGSAITGYNWTSNDGKSGSTASTSVSVGQEMGTAQVYSVSAVNANGQGASGSSNSVTTTFSFVPFGFSPFGFTPFGFTPFGFTPFGFSPFGFTPFGFSPFGFVPPFSFVPYSNFSFIPFGFIPYGNFSFAPFSFAPSSFGFVCVGEESEILTVEINGALSLTPAKYLSVGDKVISPIWDNYDASVSVEKVRVEYSSLENPAVKVGTVREIVKNKSDKITYINGNKKKAYTPTHPILAKLENQNIAWEEVGNLSVGDKVMEYDFNSERYVLCDITSLETEYFDQDVYLIGVDDTDTFIASGIVCHK